MKKFIVYLLVIICTVSLGFAVFYLVRDNEIISISSASMYKDVGDEFTLDINHVNKKASTDITVTSSDDSIVSGRYDDKDGQYNAKANAGGVARINVRTTNAKFRNIWCDVIVGDGTIESPFYISTAEQLAAIGMGAEIMAKDENGVEYGTGVFAGAGKYSKYASNLCYKLISNIDASEVNQGYWVPLRNFNGRLDGNGCTISNIYINAADYQTDLGDKADTYFVEGKPAGLLESVGKDGIVYNLKLDNFVAEGMYSKFGTVAATNLGTIERIEVKSAVAKVSTGVFGGIVGENISTEVLVEEETEEGHPIATYTQNVARIDRCSVSLTLGYSENVGAVATGTIGGLVGINKGTLVYSYVRGVIYFADDSEATITYGGIVASNEAVEFANTGFVGANIKDCYADVQTILTTTPNANSVFAGAVANNIDYINGQIDGNNRVNNYLIGIYYNVDTLNYAQEDITKEFKGVGKFVLDGDKTVTFAEKKTIVFGLTTEEMQDPENFISHVTKTLEFNEDGTSKGIVEKNVLWLFDTVWAVDPINGTNDGMPYLNYQLIYIPDDFSTVGYPVVPTTNNDYFFSLEVDYPVSIISGVEGKLRIKVGEYYQLAYSPTGMNMTWTSSGPKVVAVDEKTGLIQGKKAGVATVTVTTKSGNTDSITVIVENVAYSIDNLPETIFMYVGDKFDLTKLEITPDPDIADDTTTYTVTTVNGTNVASVTNNTTLVANSEGKATLTIKIADTTFTAGIEVTERPTTDLKLQADPQSISGYYEDFEKAQFRGIITIENDQNINGLEYGFKYSTEVGENVVSVKNVSNNQLEYTIKGIGATTIKVSVETAGYSGSVNIYFNIKAEQDVDLTLSSAKITHEWTGKSVTGSVTVKNSANTTLSYKAESNNKSVVDVIMSGNSMTYTIKGVGNATATIEVSTPHYAGIAFVSFQVVEKPAVDEPTPEGQYVELNYFSFIINEGDTLTLKATGKYNSLTWNSSNTSVATVSNGVVTAKSAGTTVITVKTDGGAEAKCSVTVKANQTTVTISVPSSVTLNEGETKQLKATGSGYAVVRWGTSNASIADISDSGLVTAISVGTATITAYAKDSNGNTKATATSTITVVPTPAIVELELSATRVNRGASITAIAKVNKSGATVTWTGTGLPATTPTGNSFTMSTSGFADGTYTITATYGDVSDSKSFRVKELASVRQDGYIYDLEDLNSMRNNLSKSYTLAANVNVGDWTPVGTESRPFTGNLRNLSNYKLTNINVSDTTYAGLFGYIKGSRIEDIVIEDSTIQGTYAGAIAGMSTGNAIIDGCKVSNSTIKSTSSTGYVGGMVGYASSTSLSNNDISATIKATKGYVGGVVGKTTASAVNNCLVTSTIETSTTNESHAGGMVGEATTSTIKSSTIRSTTIIGYYAGGIAGTFNKLDTITIYFNDYKKGFRMEDTSSFSGTVSVNKVAVRESVTVKGYTIGGMFGILKSGLVENCYSRATLNGTSGSGVMAGFAGFIQASGFTNSGGSGAVGVIRYSYVAVKFTGSGTDHAVAGTAIHNHTSKLSGEKNATKTDGYVMNYLFDNDTDGSAEYSPRQTGLFDNKDYINAKKSTSEMKQESTYSDKGFQRTKGWSFGSGYATLNSER